ncbi:MAG: glycosyltransferase family 39 protein [Caulobacteraceae bacterium]
MSAIFADGGRRLGWRAYLMLALTALVLFLPGRMRLPPVDRDEARYAQASRQMLESGDFVQVRFQDQPRNLQPVGVYWLEAASVSLFSKPQAREIWAYRVPSLVAATAAVLITAWIGEMLFGAEAGIGAALLLAMSALLSFESRMAKIDACLLATILTAQGTLLRAYLDRLKSGRLNALVFWVATGVGLLLKGPIILIVSGSTALVLVLMDRKTDWLKRLHAGWGVLVALAVAAPWFVAIGIKTHGAFFDKAVRQNLLGKIGRGEQHHGLPPGYYALLFSATFWPGALAAVFAAPWAWRHRAMREVRFLAAWVAPTWVLYELIGTKLPHYVLPLYPALACLGAGAALARDGWRSGRVGRVLATLYAVLWLVIGGLLASAGTFLIWRYLHRVDPVALAMASSAIVLLVGALVFIVRGDRAKAVGAAGIAALIVYAGLYGYALPSLTPIWLGPRIAALAAEKQPCAGSVLASTRFAEPSLVFLYRNRTDLIDPPQAADLLSHDRACAMAIVSAKQMEAFQVRAAQDRFTPLAIGHIDGTSYSTGEKLSLTLFRVAPEPPAPAQPGR